MIRSKSQTKKKHSTRRDRQRRSLLVRCAMCLYKQYGRAVGRGTAADPLAAARGDIRPAPGHRHETNSHDRTLARSRIAFCDTRTESRVGQKLARELLTYRPCPYESLTGNRTTAVQRERPDFGQLARLAQLFPSCRAPRAWPTLATCCCRRASFRATFTCATHPP